MLTGAFLSWFLIHLIIKLPTLGLTWLGLGHKYTLNFLDEGGNWYNLL